MSNKKSMAMPMTLRNAAHVISTVSAIMLAIATLLMCNTVCCTKSQESRATRTTQGFSG